MAMRSCDIRMASKGGPGYTNALPMDGKPLDPRYMTKDNDGGSLLGSGSKDACAAGYGGGKGGKEVIGSDAYVEDESGPEVKYGFVIINGSIGSSYRGENTMNGSYIVNGDVSGLFHDHRSTYLDHAQVHRSMDSCVDLLRERVIEDGEDLEPQKYVHVLNESHEALRSGGSAEDLRSVDSLEDVPDLRMDLLRK
ncbi:hypothetical protein AMTR_s00121p00081340, partial [Amborella trichopoda]